MCSCFGFSLRGNRGTTQTSTISIGGPSSSCSASSISAEASLEILNSLLDAVVVRGDGGSIVFENDAHRTMAAGGLGRVLLLKQHCLLSGGRGLDVYSVNPTCGPPQLQTNALPAPVLPVLAAPTASETADRDVAPRADKESLQRFVDSLPAPLAIVYTMKGRGSARRQTIILKKDLKSLPVHLARDDWQANENPEGRSIFQCIDHPDDYARSIDLWTHAMASGSMFQQETRAMYRGAYRWFESRAVPVSFDADGGASVYVGAVTDIDDKKRAEAAHANERGLFRAVLEQLPVAVCIAQPDSRIVFANRQAAELTHAAASHGAKTSEIAVIALSQSSETESTAAITAAVSGIDTSALRAFWGDEHTAPLAVAAAPVSNVAPALQLFLSGPTDSGAGASANSGGGIFAAAAARVLAEGGEGSFYEEREIRLPTTLGGATTEVRLSCTRILDSAGAPMAAVVVAEDISAQRQLEEDRARLWASEEAALADRARLLALEQGSMAVRAAFGNMSHELRTPLNAVLGFAELLLMSTNDDASSVDSVGSSSSAPAALTAGESRGHLSAEQVQYARSIHDSGTLLLRIINDILDYMRADSGKLELERVPFDLHRCFRLAETMLAPDAHKREVTLQIAVAPQVPRRLVGDTTRLSQVLLNLLSNALKFTSAGGSVVCTATLVASSLEDIIDGPQVFAAVDVDAGTGTGTCVALSSSAAVPGFPALSLPTNPFVAEVAARPRLQMVTLPVPVPTEDTDRGMEPLRILAPPPALAATELHLNCASAPETVPGLAPVTDSSSGSSIAAPASSRLRVEVRDTGVGLSPTALYRLFKPFSQADASTTRTFGGTGLGLSICKQLVELMGGTIGVNSEFGRGSTFWFEIPWVDPSSSSSVPTNRTGRSADDSQAAVTTTASGGADATEPPDRRRTADSASRVAPKQVVMSLQERSALRILLADDNRVNTLLCNRMLQRLGYTNVVAVADGAEAVKAVEEAAEPFALCLMDVQMPVCDGLEATRRIRALPDRVRALLPIVALSASVLPQDIESCLRAGMQGHIPKPVVVSVLETAVLNWATQSPT